MLDEIKKMVDVSRVLLDTLPKNNIKNKQKFENTLTEQKNIFENYKSEITKEIEKRIKKITNLEKNNNLEEKLNQINFIKQNLYLLNNYNSSYEKLNLDKMLYKLNHFYKEELEEVNNNILNCIEIFKKVGIELEGKDFNYSTYANKYMTALLGESTLIKNIFEEIYWKCPDLFIHIELNFKYLYYVHQKKFDKYIENLKSEFLKQVSNIDTLTHYKTLVIDYENTLSTALDINLEQFLNKSININDYTEAKVNKCYSFFTNEPYTEDIKEEIIKMSHSVKEYKEYMYFKPLIDDIKKLYNEKDKYKDNLKNKLKQIQKKEKSISLYNKKKNKNKINVKILSLINELEKLYSELSIDLFLNSLYKNITDESSLYDVLCLAASYYSYIIKYMKDNKKEGSFIEEQNRLIKFLLNPYNNILKNISIVEEKNIPLIICDRYKLSNFQINQETLEQGIEEIITNAQIIERYNKIVFKISYENIKFVIEAKDLLNK